MNAAASPGERAGRREARSAARLAAVQALYEMDMAGAPPDPVLQGFLEDRWTAALADEDGGEAGAAPDGDFLSGLVRGVTERRDDLDGMIAGALTGEWSLERLEVLLKAVLRAGVFELLALEDVPPKVVINEYVDVADAFFGRGEAGMVNGVLDRLARTLRRAEMGNPDGGKRPEGR